MRRWYRTARSQDAQGARRALLGGRACLEAAAHHRDGLVHRVGRLDELDVCGVDGARFHHGVADEVAESLPVVTAQRHDGKGLDLARLYERQGLEDLVDGAEAAGHHHEGVGVLDQQHLAHRQPQWVRRDLQHLAHQQHPSVQPNRQHLVRR